MNLLQNDGIEVVAVIYNAILNFLNAQLSSQQK